MPCGMLLLLLLDLWPWKHFSNAHSFDESLCKVSFDFPPLIRNIINFIFHSAARLL